ncbi:MAG: protein kinase [Planctomycetota bacterium]
MIDRRIESLSDRPEDPTGSRAFVQDFQLPDTRGVAASIPKHIGSYEIVSELGRGGMGVVYEAVQARPHRTVALKVVLTALASEAALRRFEFEAEVLGRLQHPNIARVYEAGQAELDGGRLPFFAMEYVRGRPLLSYAEDKALPPRERLALLARICRGVHYAHQRGVIHRDLKPANILVDGEGEPRILDFGIARLIDAEGQATRLTESGKFVGTLAYMSAEQASGDPSHVDTRTDVYALGVIGYELMAGRLPLDLSGRTVPDALRVIAETTPNPLSSTNRAFRGDLDTIFGTALAKEKDRRYESAAALADDIERFLADLPIVAQPPSALYQLRKFAKRNKILVGASVSVVSALLIGSGVAVWQLQKRLRAEAAERYAEQREGAAVVRELASAEVSRARDARAFGDWQNVIRSLDRAATHGIAWTPASRLLKVEALAALDRHEEARTELRSLGTEVLDASFRGLALLWAFELEDNPSESNEDTVARIEAAIDAGLPSAYEAYARALLASTFPEAVEGFAKALKEDPFHFQSSFQRVSHLILLGRIREAKEQLRVTEHFHHDSASTLILRALVSAADGDSMSADQWLAALAEYPDASMHEQAREALRRMAAVQAPGAFQNPAIGIMQAGPLASALARFQHRRSMLPLGHRLFSTCQLFLRGLLKADRDPEELYETTRALSELLPTPCFLGLHAAALEGAGRRAEAARLYARAADAPDPADAAVQCRHAAIAAATMLVQNDPEQHEAEFRPLILYHLEEILAKKLMLPEFGDGLVNCAIVVGEMELARLLARQWRSIVPDKVEPRLKEADVLHRQGDLLRCIELCEATLVEYPDHAATQELLEKAQGELENWLDERTKR